MTVNPKNFYDVMISAIPAIITAVVSVVALISSYKASKNATKQTYINNVDNMLFSQREKIADQISEKAALLLRKCDPNVLNTLINEIDPKPLSNAENAAIRTRLLSVSDEIATLSNIIKMLAVSILNTEELNFVFKEAAGKMDIASEQCGSMLLHLTKLYNALTRDGNLQNINVMEAIIELEHNFSEEYRDVYIDLFEALSKLVSCIRTLSIPDRK